MNIEGRCFFDTMTSFSLAKDVTPQKWDNMADMSLISF